MHTATGRMKTDSNHKTFFNNRSTSSILGQRHEHSANFLSQVHDLTLLTAL